MSVFICNLFQDSGAQNVVLAKPLCYCWLALCTMTLSPINPTPHHVYYKTSGCVWVVS